MLGTRERVLVVAEIGNNHEGDFEVAKELVRQAAAAGAHAVKFQTFRTEHYVSRANAARFARLKSFELSFPQFAELAALARALGLVVLSTPFDLESAAFLDTIVDGFKIASGDNDFFPLLDDVAARGKPLIVSTGASGEGQVERTVAFLRERVPGIEKRLALLHCVSSYPVPPEQASLRSIAFLKERFPDLVIGYSDHVIGPDAAPLAVALGARIIEKHFTLDRAFSDFRDHQLSADPPMLRELVERVRTASLLLGESEEKGILPCEEPLRVEVRRSIVTRNDLPAGHRVALSDLTWVRPGGGLAPGQEAVLVGKVLRRAVSQGERLAAGDVS